MSNFNDFTRSISNRGSYSYREYEKLYDKATESELCNRLGYAAGAGLGVFGASAGFAGIAAGALVGFKLGKTVCQAHEYRIREFLQKIAREAESDF
ncbi:hypothetical protein [Lewinella sp. IMCC34183]|uniref:hypothetical protein n=1 Tax=Lewinella sp. IMCC34183 TaxID=2248762 RepID=UPI000E23B98D|nr:hypothetical protein [Lewinella sp. IMCC34183]